MSITEVLAAHGGELGGSLDTRPQEGVDETFQSLTGAGVLGWNVVIPEDDPTGTHHGRHAYAIVNIILEQPA